jgi:hypothetical protein
MITDMSYWKFQTILPEDLFACVNWKHSKTTKENEILYLIDSSSKYVVTYHYHQSDHFATRFSQLSQIGC